MFKFGYKVRGDREHKCKMRPAAVNGQQSQSKQVSICIRDFCSK
jgi:hypothetical protein